MEWLEVRIVVQQECLSIKSRTEAFDGYYYYYFFFYKIRLARMLD